MRDAAVAAVVDLAARRTFRDDEAPLLPLQQRPRVVLLLERGGAAGGGKRVDALLAGKQQRAILQRLHMEFLETLALRGTVAPERKHVGADAGGQADHVGQLCGVHAADGSK